MLLSLGAPDAAAAESAFALSPRVNQRYQDVILTTSGSRWRGRVLERGEAYRIRLADNSEVVLRKDDILSVTRELHPALLHNEQWCARFTPGFEVAFVIADVDGGTRHGFFGEFAVARNFGGAFEPEITLAVSPVGPKDGAVNAQLGLGIRYYFQADRKAKAYTNTQLILFGTRGDLGLRTGPGFMWDISPGFGLGTHQGVTLLIQDAPEAVAVGYHAGLTAQGRF
ncbi:MAG: hypothetical protein EXR71_07000 [Myxococcales bacterium]|nr:hypothetical protein [Myxococcales bacterium]